MTRVAVSGGAGRMGKAIIRSLQDFLEITLVGAIEREGHPDIGKEPGFMAGTDDSGITITDDLQSVLGTADVLIDFTAPPVSLRNLEACIDKGVAAVVGTTGFSEEEKEAMHIFAQQTPTVISPNMSVGVNVLFKLAETAAVSLGAGYDMEIVEAHHRMKKDAPSGTAIRLAESVAGALDRNLAQHAVYSRHGMIGERSSEEIGIQTVRAGDIVGEHTLIMAGSGERLELTHRAHSRDNFAQGAVRAAVWVVGKKPGLYSMFDVLGI
ncbi:MAG: 4-hydroxy-tetrahydrodipicolinate reductase [bacterium]